MENEVWRECTIWLTRCKALRPDHKLNWSDATITDLAFTLRDGVLLCNLLNILDPDLFDMKDVNQKPQMAQFLCLRNIKTFLQACQDIYGLPQSDLFEPSMLFDLLDFYKVMRTLSKLSNCPKLRKLGIQGFCVPEGRTPSEDDIYKNLDSRHGTVDNCFVGEADVEFGAYDNHIHNEEVYHHLCSINKRNTLVTQIPATVIQNIEKRDYVINELLETEKNYVDVLNTLQKSFMIPLINILPKDDFNVIFKEIDKLVEIHSKFHLKLMKACDSCNPLRLSKVFLDARIEFIVYGDYCANLTLAQARISHCSKNDVIFQEISRCEKEANKGKFKLSDILSVPMQRILKYHLLLDKLLQETQQAYEDYRGLERAKEAMVDVAQYINDVKKDYDALNVVSAIQRNIIDWNTTENSDLKNFGRLKKDGEIKIRYGSDQKSKVRYVFVFDYVLLFCKSLRGDQYSLKEMLYLNHYKIEELLRRAINRDHSARWSHSFHLVHKDAPSVVYTFFFKSDDARKKWLTSLRDALDNVEPTSFHRTSHKFVFQTFEDATTCSFCSKFLKGRIFQGYKCSECQVAVHKGCIPHSGWCVPPESSPDIPPRLVKSIPSNQLTSHNLVNLNQSTLPEGLVSLNQSTSFLSLPNFCQAASMKDHNDDDSLLGPEAKDLIKYLWFVGAMERDQATALLEHEIDNCFLVRIRPKGPANTNESTYALSLKTDGKVKHMKIYENKSNPASRFYLSQLRYFSSLIDLIACYEHTSLAENFSGLNVKLQQPFRRIVALAEFDFFPIESNQLPLRKGCQVKILSKEGDEKGWWKGQINDRIGFFPKVYVREIADSFPMNDYSI